ncbi:MAG: SHOCT domain-containing protein [Bacteroidetes bacterium]|nr:SHOCT domain-containing protein [Bacteroidota bacterium]
MLITGVLGVIAVFLPWMTISAGFLGSQSTNGFHGIGVLAFFAFALGGAFSLIGNQSEPLEKNMWLLGLAAGALALLAVIVAISNMMGGGFGFITPSIGFGLWIALAASLGLVASAWLFRAPGATLKSGFESLKSNLGTQAPAGATPSAAASAPAASSAPASHNGAAPGGNRIAELERLVELKNKGLITVEEYEQLKTRLL